MSCRHFLHFILNIYVYGVQCVACCYCVFFLSFWCLYVCLRIHLLLFLRLQPLLVRCFFFTLFANVNSHIIFLYTAFWAFAFVSRDYEIYISIILCSFVFMSLFSLFKNLLRFRLRRRQSSFNIKQIARQRQCMYAPTPIP